MATNGAAPDLPESASKPPEGIVLPPKDIRVIVERTAGYVARNGSVFEDRIRDQQKGNSKFSFLTPGDAYAPFYQWRLTEVKAGRGTSVSAGRPGEAPPPPEKPKGPEPPPEFQFSAKMPNISAMDLEVVRLTALHVARKGKSWMTTLAQREARNYQFDFLRPQHSLHNFFQRLVDQYSALLQTGPEGQKAEQARIKALQANIQDRFRVLGLAKKRAEFAKHQESQKQKKEEAEEAERISYAQIDWHDFVVVETVLFTDADDHTDLPPPTTLNDLQSASLEQKAMMSLSRPDMRIEEAMPTDDMNGYAYDNYQDPYAQNPYQPIPPPAIQYQIPPPIPTPQPPPQIPTLVGANPYSPAPPPMPSVPTPPPSTSTPTPGQPPMRVRTDYIPRAQARTARTAGTSLCPNCGLQIPNNELDAHLRIELLDPRWKEQQAKAQSRFSTTNLGSTDVAANLKRLREKQDGRAQDPVADAASRVLAEQEEEERRKRMRFDGTGAGDQAVPSVGLNVEGKKGEGMSVQEQIRQIHSKYKS